MLQSMGSQRVRHSLAPEQKQKHIHESVNKLNTKEYLGNYKDPENLSKFNQNNNNKKKNTSRNFTESEPLNMNEMNGLGRKRPTVTDSLLGNNSLSNWYK